MKKYWWQDAIIYQIYLRSFQDSNHDGIGDIQGIIQRLDYLKDLGVNTLWISPHYDSPMDDNGYDVRDFYKVSQDYGSIDDFKELIQKAHEKDIKIITDLVLNHTSDEHPWFLAAKDPSHPDHKKFHDYYIWHEPKYNDEGQRTLPTRWISWFGGPVWEYNQATDEYYLHIFSKKMPDLNWRNKSMREDLKTMIKWWVDLGIDGFRVDASNHLEKNWDFPDGQPGYEHFSSLAKHHEYLEELGTELFIPNNLMTIGESGGAKKEEALQYAGFDGKEFNMLIQFGHCWADTDPTNTITPGKWAKGKINLVHIKESFSHWIDVFKGKGWNTIYWHNHDMPRIVSHYGNDSDYHERSAKMLAYALYLLPGTPIIYYGEEIGMTNVDYQNLNDFRDVEVFTEYENFMNNGASHQTAMQALRDRSRDNARSPMQWDDSLYAGFSHHQPWMNVNGNYKSINVEKQMNEEQSIFHTYKKLIQLRKDQDLAYGECNFIKLKDPNIFAYKTKGKTADYLVIANFSSQTIEQSIKIPKQAKMIYQNIDKSSIKKDSLIAYEARIYQINH
ncbi:alpha-glucosidase [Hujiaoplasma nucleasis]|uniref:Alpha-glucosidase n=1 Tax=Hujiaoplasma nucleasis TaxID=2725268 RepID=A0A7L6N390_9MOLU|nr:alpha-glucosidase [Hujiaoplasma nucleasis]QLY39688.1 alpha-glucosidase [Hujiaoplasma nucleasis]